jgi:hypothetical protein
VAGIRRTLNTELFKQLLLLRTPRGGQLKGECQKEIAAATFQRPTLVLKSETASWRSSRRDRNLSFAVGGHNGHHPAQGQLIETDGKVGTKLITIKSPDRMGLDRKIQIKITTPTCSRLQIPLALKAKTRSVFDPSWYADLNPLVIHRQSALSAPISLRECDPNGSFRIEIHR